LKGDFSRDTFSPRKHYSAVLMQQGRVQLDADWNEQRAIDRHRIETETGDLIGPSGGQAGNAGFEISVHDKETLNIGPGNLYVDGILCQNESPVLFEEQPDLPGTRAIDLLERDLQVGLVYLDVWERHITGLEDGAIREVALGGPDTTTRSKTVWQIKVLPVQADTSNIPALQPLLDQHVGTTDKAELARINNRILGVLGVDCDSLSDELQLAHPPSTGQLLARALPPASAESPCVVAPGAGYERVENQLYRVEIHDGGGRGNATFKWSRDNGSVVTAVLEVTPRGTGAEIAVRDLGRDETLGFAIGQYVELVSDDTERFGLAEPLVQITDVDPVTRTVTVERTTEDQTFPNVDPNNAHAFHYKLRRWDSPGAVPIPVQEGAFVELEGGIQVRFTGGRYNTGDYWLIPARTATGAIEWPENRTQPPAGVRHHYAQLALVMVATTAGDEQPSGAFQRALGTSGDSPPILPASRVRQLLVLADCRRLYPPVTELTSLFYLSGDGQEAGSGQPLPRPLVVGVANGNKPVPGARVRFTVQTGGQLQADGATGTSVTVTTDARGEARCAWTLATGQSSQQVKASLVDGTHLSVYFNANLSAAGEAVAESIQITRLLLGQPGQPSQPSQQDLLVDGRVSVTSLVNGIHIVCDPNSFIDEQAVVGKPTCFVTVDMPFPQNSADRTLWGTNLLGFQPLILAAQVSVSPDGKRIIWTPTAATIDWLQNRLFQATPAVPTELTAHLTLKGNFIWDKNRPQAYLDGDIFGRRSSGAGIELGFPSGDGRRGGDFDMWFRLVAQTLLLDAVTLTPSDVVGGGTQVTVTGTVRISGTAPAGGTPPISLQSSDATVASVPANVTIQGGQSSQTFQVTTQPVTATRTVTITATLTPPAPGTATTRTVNLILRPPVLTSVTLGKSSTVGKTETIQGTVTLNGRAPTGGVVVTLSSNSANAKLQQTSVTVPAGSTSTVFQVTTEPVDSALLATITATSQGVTQTTTLTIQPPTVSTLSLNPSSVRGGSTSTATLTISGPAPANFIVSLDSFDTNRATVPVSVTVPANSPSTTFTVSAKPVSFDGAVTIRATRAGVQSTAPLTVLAPGLTGFTFDPSLIDGGATSTGRITLNGPAPSGTSVTLSPTDNTAATFPASVSVSFNATQIIFTATGRTFTGTTNRSVTVTASYLGGTLSATLTVRPTKSKEKEKETKEKETEKVTSLEKVASIEKSPETPLTGRSGIEGPGTAEGEPAGTDEESGALGRAFVQPNERPVAGQQALDQPPTEEEDPRARHRGRTPRQEG
jgi:hypothetical protein